MESPEKVGRNHFRQTPRIICSFYALLGCSQHVLIVNIRNQGRSSVQIRSIRVSLRTKKADITTADWDLVSGAKLPHVIESGHEETWCFDAVFVKVFTPALIFQDPEGQPVVRIDTILGNGRTISSNTLPIVIDDGLRFQGRNVKRSMDHNFESTGGILDINDIP